MKVTQKKTEGGKNRARYEKNWFVRIGGPGDFRRNLLLEKGGRFGSHGGKRKGAGKELQKYAGLGPGAAKQYLKMGGRRRGNRGQAGKKSDHKKSIEISNK